MSTRRGRPPVEVPASHPRIVDVELARERAQAARERTHEDLLVACERAVAAGLPVRAVAEAAGYSRAYLAHLLAARKEEQA